MGRFAKIFLLFFFIEFFNSIFSFLSFSQLLREITGIDTKPETGLIFKDVHKYIYIRGEKFSSDEFYLSVELFQRVAEGARRKWCYKVDCSINGLYMAWLPLSANRQWIPMEIYITLCVGDWSTGTSDFIEAAGIHRDGMFRNACVRSLFFFPQPRSSVILLPRFEKNSITRPRAPVLCAPLTKKHR